MDHLSGPAEAGRHDRYDGNDRERQLLKELESLQVRTRETARAIGNASATLAEIYASNVWKVTRLLQRLKGAPAPVPAIPPRLPLRERRATGEAPTEIEDQVEAERAELARLQEESRRIHEELQKVMMSRPRKLLLAARLRAGRAFVLARHPLWTLRTGVSAAAAGRRLALVRSGARRLRHHTVLFRFLAIEGQETNQPVAADAIKWLPPVRISGESFHALFCHPESSVVFKLHAPGGTRVVTRCALLPKVWQENAGGVEFTLAVQVPETGWSARRSLRVDPRRRWADRRWRRLALRIPAGVARDVVVTLQTRLPEGASAGSAWSAFGEPRAEWPRTGREQMRSARALWERLRELGLRDTLRQIRDLQASQDEHAVLYRRWVEANTPGAEALARMREASAALAYRPRISIVTPVFNTDPKWLRACIESVRRQAYPEWELCLCDDASTSPATRQVLQEYERDPRIHLTRLDKNAGIAAASNAALALATGEFAALLDHDDELTPDALYEVAAFLNGTPDADFIYSDEDKLDYAGGRCDPYFKPDWSPEHFLSTMYTCHLMVARTSLVREAGGFRAGFEGAQDYDLVLRLTERTTRIHHLPKILYHWRKIEGSVATSGQAKTWAMDSGERAVADCVLRRNLDAVVVAGPAPGLYRVRHRIKGKPLVSLAILTDGRTRQVAGRTVDLVGNAVESIAQKSTYESYEIVIADNGRLQESTERVLRSVPHRRVTFEYTGTFNFSRKMNFAVGQTRGEHVVLLNDDIEVITPEWIEAMLEFSQQDEIGVVGAKLLYPDGRLQHIGMVLGVSGMSAHAFHSHPGSSAGYGSSALIIRNYSAVTAACMMTRREIYDRLGGFDERFVFDFNDTDYCLRVRQAGYRIVFTPYAQLYHLEMATSGMRAWNPEEVEEMRRRWGRVFECDPYYNPNLTREFPDYRVRV